jgi:uncharacterized membrane protein
MFMALTYVFVPILSAVLLREQIGVMILVGTFLIISGIIVSGWN